MNAPGSTATRAREDQQGLATKTSHAQGPFLAVCGHTNLDVHLHVKELPKPGQSTPVLDRRVLWGGTACNIAVHAASLGVATRLWSRVGPDFPADWRTALLRLGIGLEFLEMDAASRTPTCTIATDLLERQQFFMDQGAMGRLDENPVPAAVAAGVRGWLHIATGDPLAYAQVASEAKARGLRVALDPGQELSFQYNARSLAGLLEVSDVFWCNDDELRVACDLLDVPGPAELLRWVPTVIATKGAKGAALHRRGQPVVEQPAFPVAKLVDPTGAGDAMRAGWYASLQAGGDATTALRWGQAAASLVVQTIGGQSAPVTRNALERVLTDSSA